eukprot:jgi/Orpsp1_1/1179281/evm.model.c7180000068727.1
MQLHKAKVLNTIPAFNIKKEYRNSKDGDGDAVILSYCQEHQVICDLMKTLNPIWMTEMFYKNKFSAPFWEARLLLPNEIRKFILGKRDLKPIFSHILDAKVINSESNDIYVNIICVILAIYMFSAMFIIYLVYKYRNHPYLKMFSPHLCNLVIVGMIMCNIYPITHAHYTNTFICKFIYLIGIISRNLIFLPMVSMVYRIYYIYTNTSEVNFGRRVANKRIYLFISSILLIELVMGSLVVIFKDFFIVSLNDFDQDRLIFCAHHGTTLHVGFIILYSFTV